MAKLNPKSRAELDDILRPFNDIGAYTNFTTPAKTELEIVLDHLYVVRASPVLDSDDRVENMDWWLGWFPIDWNSGGFIYRPHVTHVESMSKEDDYWLRIRGESGERLDLYWFVDPVDDDRKTKLSRWKEEAPDDIGVRMERSMEYMREIANTWPAPKILSPIDLTDTQKERWQF